MDRYSAGPHGAAEIRNSIDYRTYNSRVPFKRFYRVAKYAKTKSLVWRNANDAITGAAGGFAGLPNC